MSKFKKLAVIAACMVLAIGAMSTAASAEGIVTLYSESGAAIQVNDWEVSAYEAVGWHSNYADVVTTLYSADGSSITVYNSQVAEYVAVGWYTAPVTTIYTIYGDSMLIYTADLPAYTAIGWSANYADVTTTLYSADGSTITVYNAQVDSYLAVGWSKTKPVVKVSNYANSDIPDFGKATGATYKTVSTLDTGVVYSYRYDDSDIYEYAEYLIADGWSYISYNDGLYFYKKGNASVGFSCHPEYGETWVLILNDHRYVSGTTTTASSAKRYYSGTSVLDYGYVTGRSAKFTRTGDAEYAGATYTYYNGDYDKYKTALQNDGWKLYDVEDTAEGQNIYFVKNNRLLGVFYDSYDGTITVIAPKN